jgi:isopentenyl phosphate kinase
LAAAQVTQLSRFPDEPTNHSQFRVDAPAVVTTIKEIRADEEELAGCNLWETRADFTGGMRLKLKCAFELAKHGITTHIVDGRQARSLSNVLASRHVDGGTILAVRETAP